MPSQKEYEKSVKRELLYIWTNGKHVSFSKAFKQKVKSRWLFSFLYQTSVEMKFLLGVTTIVTCYLTFLQSTGPVVHYIFEEMKMLFGTILLQFIKPEVADNCKLTKELLEINVEYMNIHLPAKSIDFGPSAVKRQVKFQFHNCLITNEITRSFIMVKVY